MRNPNHSPTALAALKLTSELVAIRSVFPNEQELALYIETYLQALEFTVERIPAKSGRDCIVASYGQSSNFMCLYGHMDTVPPDPQWQQDPFTVTTHEDEAFGLGVVDMKGGVAAILLTATYAREHGLPIKVAFGVDEENISLGSYVLTQSDFFKDVRCLISAESGQIFDESQDFSLNFGRKGRFVIEATLSGVTAHAARSDLAINAITEAARFVDAVRHLQLPIHPNLGETQIIPFHIDSSTDAFSIPALARIFLNVLSVPGVSSATMVAALQKLARDLHIQATFALQARPTPYMEAYEVDTEDPWIQDLKQEVLPAYTVTPTYSISVADENRFAHDLLIPVISLGPIGGEDHTAKEWVRISSLGLTVGVFQKILKRFHSMHQDSTK